MRNYARHVKTQAITFLRGDEFPAHGHPSQYAFWRVPTGVEPGLFLGSLIGESSDQYAQRVRPTALSKASGGAHQNVSLSLIRERVAAS